MSCSDEYFSHSICRVGSGKEEHNKNNNEDDNDGSDYPLIQITPKVQDKLKKAKYGVYNHSAVELCHWTKKSFANEGDCYKHKFYGISTHQCMEMTPTAMNCENRCVYCWRPAEFYDTLEMPEHMVDDPEVIVQNLMAERKKLINGFYGHSKNDKTKLDESLLPAHYAISLSGEPTMYPKLPQMIKYLRSLKPTKSIFLVTNGQEPDMLRRLAKEDALPTQIYLSTNASNKKMFLQVNRPRHKDAWERWQDSLRFLSTVDTRTVLRMTLIRGYNNDSQYIAEFAKLISEGDPHFIEIKSYMHIGMSTQRLEKDSMLEMEEVREYAAKLCEEMQSFSEMDESEVSRIIVLQNKKRYVDRWIKSYLP